MRLSDLASTSNACIPWARLQAEQFIRAQSLLCEQTADKTSLYRLPYYIQGVVVMHGCVSENSSVVPHTLSMGTASWQIAYDQSRQVERIASWWS